MRVASKATIAGGSGTGFSRTYTRTLLLGKPASLVRVGSTKEDSASPPENDSFLVGSASINCFLTVGYFCILSKETETCVCA